MQTSRRAGILTTEQLRCYDADGFLVLPGYFDAQAVEELTEAAGEVLARVGPLVRGNPRVQVDRLGDQVGVRQAWPVIDLSETMARFAADERVVGLFRDLFGGEVPVLFEDKLNFKHPEVGTQFPMHQDFSYWHAYSPRLTSAMIYLDVATEENGCLEVVPGWHQRGLLERTEMDVGPAMDHHVPAEVLDPTLARRVPGEPGTLILFSCMTPHRSGPNRSDRSRRALILTYNPKTDGDFYEATSGAARDRGRAWLSSRGASAG
jgi:hypothetical protein